jgi:uncharacterized protein
MLEFNKLRLEHRERFNEVIKKYNYRNSESSFASLYFWSKYEQIEIAFGEHAMFLRYLNDEGEKVCFSPVMYDMSEPIRPAIREIRSFLHCEDQTFCITGVIKEKREKIESEYDHFVFDEDRDNFDYIYESEKLINLSGKKLSAKRNHINFFLNNYTHEYKQYDLSLKGECLALIDSWHQSKDEDKFLDKEIEVLKKMLDEYELLDLKGAVVYVNGKIEALTFGCALSEDTALIHMEKANAEIRGLYPFINQQFIKNEWADYKYINREEDMGIEGLRKAKLSYYPAFMVEKYACSLDGNCNGR